MVRSYEEQRFENVRYWAKCKNDCGKVIRNRFNAHTAFYWKKHCLCRDCFLSTHDGQEYKMSHGKVVKK